MTLPQPLSRSSGQGEIFRRCALNLMFNTRSLKSKIIPTQSLTSEPFGTFVHFFTVEKRCYRTLLKTKETINIDQLLIDSPIPSNSNPRLLQFPDAFLCFHPDSADRFATDCPWHLDSHQWVWARHRGSTTWATAGTKNASHRDIQRTEILPTLWICIIDLFGLKDFNDFHWFSFSMIFSIFPYLRLVGESDKRT